jgi:hypothetical protein
MVLIITTDYVISCTWVYNYAIAKKENSHSISKNFVEENVK